MPTPREARTPAGADRAAMRLRLLRVFGALLRPFTPRTAPGRPRRILVLRPDHLGDALFTTPALRALRELYPDARMTALVGPWSTAVYGRLSSLDEVMPCAFPGFGSRPKRHLLEPYGRLLAEAARLRREGFDLAINLRFDFWWGAMLAQLACIPKRLGYAVPECVPFLSRAVPYARGRHEVSQNLGLVAALAETEPGRQAEWLAARLACARLEFPLRSNEEAKARQLLRTEGEGPFLAIHPGTRGLAKLWTTEGWATVADALATRVGVRVLLTGSEAEGGLCRAVAARMRAPARVLAGGTTLGELVAVFARCALVLGVDSGPLHFATALDVPTVHLYGPSDHVAFAPFGNPARHAVVRSGVQCSPCNKLDWSLEEMADHDCMRAIDPGVVIAAAERVLGATGAITSR